MADKNPSKAKVGKSFYVGETNRFDNLGKPLAERQSDADKAIASRQLPQPTAQALLEEAVLLGKAGRKSTKLLAKATFRSDPGVVSAKAVLVANKKVASSQLREYDEQLLYLSKLRDTEPAKVTEEHFSYRHTVASVVACGLLLTGALWIYQADTTNARFLLLDAGLIEDPTGVGSRIVASLALTFVLIPPLLIKFFDCLLPKAWQTLFRRTVGLAGLLFAIAAPWVWANVLGGMHVAADPTSISYDTSSMPLLVGVAMTLVAFGLYGIGVGIAKALMFHKRRIQIDNQALPLRTKQISEVLAHKDRWLGFLTSCTEHLFAIQAAEKRFVQESLIRFDGMLAVIEKQTRKEELKLAEKRQREEEKKMEEERKRALIEQQNNLKRRYETDLEALNNFN